MKKKIILFFQILFLSRHIILASENVFAVAFLSIVIYYNSYQITSDYIFGMRSKAEIALLNFFSSFPPIILHNAFENLALSLLLFMI